MCRIGTVSLPQKLMRIGPQKFRNCNAAICLIGSVAPALNTRQTQALRGLSLCKASARAEIPEIFIPPLRICELTRRHPHEDPQIVNN
jgi:hypothetical protein